MFQIYFFEPFVLLLSLGRENGCPCDDNIQHWREHSYENMQLPLH